jgi:hypothetical protein
VEIINIFSLRETGKILLRLGSDVFFYILCGQARMFKSQTTILGSNFLDLDLYLDLDFEPNPLKVGAHR